MQVLCVLTSEPGCDLECPVCHNRYALYYSRRGAEECEQARQDVQTALLHHHAHHSGPEAHPPDAFNIPAWNGPAYSSGAALLSGARMPKPAPRASASQPAVADEHRRVS